MAFVAEAALIALREGLEAFLITGLLLAFVTKLGRPDARKHVWAGFAAAAAASLALGYVVQRYLWTAFEERGGGELFELVAALAAVVVLTYMVVWMWQHTRALMTTLRKQVAVALTKGALTGVVLLTFASVIREGLEVVLFYGALLAQHAPADVAWSGALGFVASAAIVLAILKSTARLNLQKFFGVTGLLLVFIAAGLLVHSVHAATALGYVPPAGSVWDTSGAIPDDSAAGRVLHAIVGYTATPTALQAFVYFAYVFGVGGWYLASLGAFTRRTTDGARVRRGRAGVAAFLVLVVTGAVLAGAANPGPVVSAHDHGHGSGADVAAASIPDGEKIGVLLRSHGEPVHYNETTYAAFAEFVRNLLTSLGYGPLLEIDQGTVLLDKSRPWVKGYHADAELMDAWTHAFDGPAAYVGAPVPVPADVTVPFFDGYYLAPGTGPGLGEPDVLEMAGLSSYLSWLQMANESPMHFDKLQSLEAAERALKARYGDAVVIQQSYHIRPHVATTGESDADAAAAFVDAGVTLVVDAYTSALHSDVMNECMMKPHLLHAFHEAGYEGPVVHAERSTTSHHYMDGLVEKVRAELAREAADARVAVFLTHHGLDPNAESPCRDRADPYNAQARDMFAHATKHLSEAIPDERVRFFHVYGQGAGAADDGVLSPFEAIDAAKEWGADVVVDVPYELSGDGFDNLVNQRASYGLAPEHAPHHDEHGETHLTIRGMRVRITSGHWGSEARGLALADVIDQAIADALGASAAGGHEDAH